MPIQIKDLAQGARSVRVEYNGDSLNFQYRSGANTAQAAIEMQERMAEEDANQTEVLVERLAELVASWDLMDGDKPVPVTKQTLLGLPIPLISAMLQAVADDQSPTKPKSRR